VSVLDRALARPATWRALVLLAIAIRVMFVLAPFDVLHPVDPHELGQRVLHGEVPYRDFGLEYPPGAVLAMLLPGLVPSALAPSVLALLAVACEAVVWWSLDDMGAKRRYLLLSTLVFPILSGGFDAFAMAAVAASTSLLARGDRRGWWVAGLGAVIKVFPGIAWGWMARWGRTGTVALAVTLGVLLAPLALGDGRDVYVNYHVERGVQQETIAASVSHLAERLTGGEVEVAYRFRAQEIVGAEWIGTVALVLFGGLAVAMAIRVRVRPVATDPWLLALAFLLVVLCGSKVLSPQFVVMAVPLAAAAGGGWSVAYLPIAALSMGASLDEAKGARFMDVVLLRNLLLVGVALAAAGWVLAGAGARPREAASPAGAMLG
jgi:hypothetical protein